MNKPIDTLTTANGSFAITLAEEKDLERIRQMLVEAADWMQTNGVKQWNPQQFTPELIRSYYNERDIYLLHASEEPVAMFTLQNSDPDYWGELNVVGYSYLHRLTISLPFRGRGLGGDMLRWAAKRSKALGRTGLRLDCWSQNLKLNQMYQSCGFLPQGTGSLNGREFNLYQLEHSLYIQS